MREKLVQLEAVLAALTGSQGIDELSPEQTLAVVGLAHRLAHEVLQVCPAD